MKLTKAQAELLSGNTRILFNRRTGEVYTSDDRGFTVRVNKSTFNALTVRGLLALEDGTGGEIARYVRTPAGRAALEASE